jgi:hypothetical protein
VLQEPEADDYIDIQPWPVPELAGTLIACVALGRRGLLDIEEDGDPFARETDAFELEAWARLELMSWLSPADASILESPLGSLGDEHIEQCHDALIRASSIAWALGVIPASHLPVFSDGEPERITAAWAPGPWTQVRSVMKGLRVRDDHSLGAERERWEILYWRLMLDQPLDPDARAALADTVREVNGARLLPATSNDLATDGGRAIGDLDAAAAAHAARESEIRLQTLNWTCGLGQTIDTTPLMLGVEEDVP